MMQTFCILATFPMRPLGSFNTINAQPEPFHSDRLNSHPAECKSIIKATLIK